MNVFSLILFAFLLGSIPFGVVVARVYGVNLKKVGSGNIGATNVLRAMGKGPALLTLVGDVLKGSLAVVVGKYFFQSPSLEGIMGLSAIVGHNFSLFLRFRGGKGVATSIGVLLIYSPKVGVLTVILWLIVILVTRYSSLGALVSFGVLPLGVYVLDYTQEKLIVSILIASLLVLRHTDNIKRLLQGTEPKIGKRV
ncbi:MAG TPA: glycerol-3-phosphate 1-O-acyltransferase PlsY [Thermodesulfovibrionales bacterium]|nr:glycerol-3-phosphate 1-O-acyltransferase PlsY [Thermodesulfovibrionales bacterium]